MTDKLQALIDSWRKCARRKFLDARHETDDMGKRLIEHGAVCYANCAEELEAILKATTPPEPPPLTDLTGLSHTSWHRIDPDDPNLEIVRMFFE